MRALPAGCSIVLLAVGVWLSPALSTSSSTGWAGDAVATADFDLLEKVADQYQANKAAIVTWRGRALVTDDVIRPGRPATHQVNRVVFTDEALMGSKLWLWQPPETKPGAAKNEAGGVPPNLERTPASGMIKDGAYYRTTNLLRRRPHGRFAAIHIQAADEVRFGPLSPGFDPFYFLTNNGRPLDERFRFLHKLALSGKAVKELSVSRKGTRVTVELKGGGNMTRYIADLAQGGNLVGFESRDPTGSHSTVVTISHARVDRIWIPDHYVYRQEDKVHKRVTEREIKWTENVLNGPLKDEDFSLAVLGVQPNDLIEDLRTNAVYPYRASKSKPANPAPTSKGATEKNPPTPH